jgi:UPF0271 protein
VKHILDTSALFSMQDLPPEPVTAPGVIAELKKYDDTRLRYWEDRLTVSAPSSASLEKVKRAAAETGDDARLSPVDMEVLALAMDVKGVILTDDYSIQNLARVLELEYRAVGLKGIKEVIVWKYRCRGCGKIFDKNMPDCPICGSALRSVRSREAPQK